jgi:hypothetical protein
VKFAKNFEKSPWFAAFNKNREFYDWIQAKIANYLSDLERKKME